MDETNGAGNWMLGIFGGYSPTERSQINTFGASTSKNESHPFCIPVVVHLLRNAGLDKADEKRCKRLKIAPFPKQSQLEIQILHAPDPKKVHLFRHDFFTEDCCWQASWALPWLIPASSAPQSTGCALEESATAP